MSKTRTIKVAVVWQDEFYLRAYQLARSGMGKMQIARAIGVSWPTFKKWLDRKEALRTAIKDGSDPIHEGKPQPFQDYVYGNMDPHTKAVYDKVRSYIDPQTAPRNAVVMLEELMRDQGDKMRKSLFLHFYASHGFNPSAACHAVNIKKKTLERWCITDQEFYEMMEEMRWHMKNFCRGRAMDLVAAGDASMTKFMLSNLDEDFRKTPSTTNINIQGRIEHEHNLVDVDKIPLKIRMQMMDAIENERDGDEDEILDAEYEVKADGN